MHADLRSGHQGANRIENTTAIASLYRTSAVAVCTYTLDGGICT